MLGPTARLLQELRGNSRQRKSDETPNPSYQLDVVAPDKQPRSSGIKVLLIFGIITVVYAICAAIQYWNEIVQNKDLLNFSAGLFLVMVAGMFVQVIAANYKAGHPLFSVTWSQLVFPLLFGLVVYYPIWALAASSPRNLFSFYAAFLNGYFWESVVSAAKRPVDN